MVEGLWGASLMFCIMLLIASIVTTAHRQGELAGTKDICREIQYNSPSCASFVKERLK